MNPICPSLFLYGLRSVTEAAARAAYDWIGRGDKTKGDHAAIAAMEACLNQLPINGRILVGEGSKDEAPELYNGQELGRGGDHPEYDIVVDPVEGTSYLMRGMTNAMAVVGVAPKGTMFDPGPAFYMEKFAGPPAVRGKIAPDMSVEEKLNIVAKESGKPISDLNVFVLEKPRHRDLVDRIHSTGARVALYPAGDVAGAIMPSVPGSGIDCMMGTGGCPEGMLSACAISALGGEFMIRIDPQLALERHAVEKAGIDIKRWRGISELITSPEVYFCATGITTGLMFDGVERSRDFEKTQTFMIAGPCGERQILTTYHRRQA